MENKNLSLKPEDKKSSSDMMKLVVGIFVVIIVMVALKYLVSALGII